jgi:hypothetical protein
MNLCTERELEIICFPPVGSCATQWLQIFFFEIQWLQFVEEEAGGLLKKHDSEVGGCGRVYS